ncbi:MAG: PAS domain S-box protein, partial [Candidatus Brocadiia bacterium]
SGDYDLIFLDFHLEAGLSGLEALARIRPLAPELPVIVLTGTHAVQPAVEMIKNGAVDYLLKDNFDRSVLERSIRYALEEQRLTSERQEAYDALRRSENRFRSLFNGIPDIVLVHDRHGVILHANDVGARRLGWSQQDLAGVSLQSIMAPEFADRVEQRARRALEDGVFSYSAAYLSRTGRRIEVEINQRRIEFEARPAVLSVGRDVTERRHADRAFRESAGRFHSVLQSFRDVAYRWVLRRGTFSYVSPSVEEVLGFTPAQLISMGAKQVYRRIHPEDARRYREQTERLLRHPGEERPESLAEYRIRRADGRYVWVSESRNVTTDRAGRPTAVVGSLRDVTSRHRAEEAIRQSGRQLEAALSQVPEWVYVKDSELRYLYVNEAFASARGRTAQEIVGKSDNDLFPAQIARRYRSEDRRILEEGEAVVLEPAHGEALPDDDHGHRWTKIPVRDQEGQLCALVGVCGSPARQQRLEQMLLHWAALTRSSADGILGVSLDGTVLSWNPGAETLYGYSAEDMCGRSVVMLDPEGADGALPDVLKLAAGGESVRDFETVHVSSDGRPVPVALSMAPLMGTDGEVAGVSIIARDIAERKEAEQRLRASEHQYRTTLNAMGDAIHVVDGDLRIVLVNPALQTWLEELGLKGEIAGGTVREAFPFLPEQVEAEYERVFRTAQMLRTEETTEVGGRHIITETRKIPVVENGQVIRVVTAIRDVTEHRRAQKALEESERRYRELWDQAPAAYHIIDPEGIIQRVNQTELDMLGYGAEEMVGHSIFDFVRPDQRAEARQRFQAKLAGQRPPKAVNRAYVRKDGSEVYVSIDDVMERDSEGDIVSIRTTMVDVTEQVELREKLRASEQRFRLLVNTVLDGISICEWDPETGRRKMVYCNDRLVEMSGYSREELMAAGDLNELGVSYLSEEEEQRNRQRLLEGLPARGTASWKRPDGKENIQEWSAVAVPVGRNYHIFGVDRDITERVRAEEEQRRLEEQVRRTQKLESLGVLAGGIAHDFNNLLTGVLGNAGLALADLPPDSQARFRLQTGEIIVARREL